MATLLEYAKKSRIRTQRLLDYLAEQGYEDIEPDSELPEEAVSALDETFATRQASEIEETDRSLLESLRSSVLEYEEDDDMAADTEEEENEQPGMEPDEPSEELEKAEEPEETEAAAEEAPSDTDKKEEEVLASEDIADMFKALNLDMDDDEDEDESEGEEPAPEVEQPVETEASGEASDAEMDLEALFSQLDTKDQKGEEEGPSEEPATELLETPSEDTETEPEPESESPAEPDMSGETLDLESLLSTLDIKTSDESDYDDSSDEPEEDTAVSSEPEDEETVELEQLLMSLNMGGEGGDDEKDEKPIIKGDSESETKPSEQQANGESKGKLAALAGLMGPLAGLGDNLRTKGSDAYQFVMGPLTKTQKLLLMSLLLVVAFFTALAIVMTVSDFGTVTEGPLLEEAKQSLALGDTEKATKQFLTLVNKFPDSPAAAEAWITLADMLFDAGKYDEALTTYRRLIEYQNKKMKAEGALEYPSGSVRTRTEIRIAECQIALNRYNEATQELLLLQDRYPAGEPGQKIQQLLIENYLKWGRYADKKGFFQLGAEASQQFLRDFPNASNKPEVLELQGDHYVEMAKREQLDPGLIYSEALASYQQAEKSYQEMPTAIVPLRIMIKEGDVQLKMADYPQAKQTYESILASSRLLSETPEVTIKLAKCLLKQGEPSQAARYLEDLVDRYSLTESEEAAAQSLLGDAYFDWKRYDLMQDAYRKAVELERYLKDEDISPMRAHMRMTNFLYFGAGRYVEAIRQYETILAKYPEGRYRFRALYLIAEAYARIDRLKDAARYYKMLIEENPRLTYVDPACLRDSFFKLGKIYYRMNEYPKAIRAYEALLAEYPNDKNVPRVLEKVGDCYAQLESVWIKAEETYQRIINDYPEAPNWSVAGLKLGQVEENMGKLDAAQDVYRRIVLRDPNDVLAPEAEYRRLDVELRKAATEPGVASERRYMSVLADSAKLKVQYPQYPKFARQEGIAAYFLRDFEQASLSLEDYVSRTGDLEDLPHSHFLLGDSFYRLRDYAASADYLKRRIEQEGDPNEKANALYLLAMSQKQLNDPGTALGTLDTLIKQHPSSSFIPEASAERSRLIWERDNADYLKGG